MWKSIWIPLVYFLFKLNVVFFSDLCQSHFYFYFLSITYTATWPRRRSLIAYWKSGVMNAHVLQLVIFSVYATVHLFTESPIILLLKCFMFFLLFFLCRSLFFKNIYNRIITWWFKYCRGVQWVSGKCGHNYICNHYTHLARVSRS